MKQLKFVGGLLSVVALALLLTAASACSFGLGATALFIIIFTVAEIVFATDMDDHGRTSFAFHLLCFLGVFLYAWISEDITNGFFWMENLPNGEFEEHHDPAWMWNILWVIAGIRAAFQAYFEYSNFKKRAE